ncbi:MAG TPA: serpin family protein [Longimicrobium sp.]|jgi:serpin B|uniref:serpin family protein n=1 Tax=Longimicrobium sp. TaxID=2029185 RepID=UPI002ED8B3FD
MRWSKPLTPLALATTLAGCESIFGSGDEEPITRLPRALTQSEQDLIVASNRFGFNLLREVSARDSSSNIFLSPLSASMALGMTMNGARGETFTGMRSTLGFGAMEPAQINASYRSLIDLLLGLDGNVDMRLANSIWVDQRFPLHPAFVESSLQHFDARVTALDFANPASANTINGWVDQGTNGKIKTIIDGIDAGVVMYLINAVYFKGSWTQEFDPARTSPAPFHRADGGQHSVQMMFLRDAKVRSVMNDQVQMVDLAYGRGAFSMTLVLPPNGQPLRQWAAGVTDEKWQTWVAQLRDTEMDVLLPRFRLEYDEVLNKTLQALGMGTAFDEGAADFGGMSPLGADLFITNVKQKTFLEVNEKGTEAAAATSVEMGVTSGPPTFIANRPFLVAIRERHSGTILFVGLIGDPRSP